jgi:phospholipid/cholesterol/gamma-HCH transport system substrate-binding protein
MNAATVEFREQDRRFEGLNLRTGLFLALALLIVAAAVAGTLIRQGVFTQTSRLYFFSASAAGIARGMSVQLSGFKIGTVENLALEPDARVKVQLLVNSEYMRHITQDAEARLAKEGLIGASIIEIAPGSTQARPMPNNGVLKFERAGDFAQMTQALTDKLDPILDDLKKLTESINDPQGDIRLTLRNIREATAMMAGLQQDLSRLALTAKERTESLTGKAEQTLERTAAAVEKAGVPFEKASAAIDTLHGTLSALDKQLPATLLRVERTLGNLESVSADARRVTAGLAADLPPAVQQGRALVEDTREIMDGAKQSWPIRSFLGGPLEGPLPLDSHDGSGKP